MLIKTINNAAQITEKQNLINLKKSTLLNIKYLPGDLLSILKRLFNNYLDKKISLSLLNFILKDNLLKKLMPIIKIVVIPSYGYHDININDFKKT